MIDMKPLDPAFPIQQQLGTDAGPVVLVNVFTVDPSDREALVDAWKNDAQWMKRQPGYISTQLHAAVGESSMYLNYAVWDSVADSVRDSVEASVADSVWGSVWDSVCRTFFRLSLRNATQNADPPDQ